MSALGTAPVFPPFRNGTVAVALGLIATAGIVMVLWWWGSRSEQEAISELAPDERRALYERTLQNLKSTCEPATRPSGLDGYCRRQADFILKFPECDGECAQLARQQKLPSR